MVVLLVHPAAQAQHHQRVEGAQQMEAGLGDHAVDDDFAEVADVDVHRVHIEQILDLQRIGVDVVEDGGQVHQEHGEHAVEVFDVPEEDEQGREHHPHADVEYGDAHDGIDEQQEVPVEGDALGSHEDEEDHQGQQEVDEGLHVAGEQEHVLGHVHLGKDPGVAHQGAHAAGGGVVEVGKEQIAAEEVDGIVLGGAAKELGEDQRHDNQRQQRGDDAPYHAQYGALVLLLEVPLDQLLKEEAVLF